MPTYDVTVEKDGVTQEITFEGDRPPTPSDIDEAWKASSAQGPVNQQEPLGPPEDLSNLTLPQRFQRALYSASKRLQPLSSSPEGAGFLDKLLEGVTTPFRLPGAIAEGLSTLAPETAKSLTEQAAILGPIEPVARAVDSLKFEPNRSDSGAAAVGKAAVNVGLEVGKQLASPLGVGTALAGIANAPATAAVFMPAVLDSIEAASREWGSNEQYQTRRESMMMAALGVVGTTGGLRGNVARGPQSASRAAKAADPATELGREARMAAADLEASTGLAAPLTPGELGFGNPRREALVKRLGRGNRNELLPHEAQQEAVSNAVIRSLREGANEAGTAEAIGTQIAKQLTAGDEALATAAAKDIARSAQQTAAEAEGTVRGVGPRMEQTQLGDRLRSAVNFKIEAEKQTGKTLFKEAEDARVAAGGGTNDRFVVQNNVNKAAQSLLDQSRKRSVSAGGVEPDPNFLPALKKLEDLANNKTPQTAIEQQRGISAYGDAIGAAERGVRTELASGFDLGDLKVIYKAMRADFDDSLKGLSGDAATKYKRAIQHHRERIEAFEQNKIIGKIANDAADGGIANTGEVAGMFARGEGKLNDLLSIRDFLPDPDYKALKAGIIDSLRGRSSIPTALGPVEDLTKFSESFLKLAPEIKRELMGSDAAVKSLQSTLDQFGTIKRGSEMIGNRAIASAGAVSKLLDDVRFGDAKAGAKRFGEAIAKEQARRRDYANKVTGWVKQRNLGEVAGNVDEFAQFILDSKDVNLVQQSLQLLDAPTRQAARKIATRTFVEMAADTEQSSLAHIERGEPIIDFGKLVENYTKDPKRKAVIDAIVPEEDKVAVNNLLKYQRAIQEARKAGGQSGLVAAQSIFGGGLNDGLFSTVTSVAESFVKMTIGRKFAEVYFSKQLQPLFERVADRDFLTTAVAAWGKSKMDPNGNIPRLGRDGLMALSQQFGAARVNDYLQKKAEIDKILAGLNEDETDAVVALMPEVATPLHVD